MLKNIHSFALPVWRALVLAVLCVIGWELHQQHKEVRDVANMLRWQENPDWGGVKDRLDTIDNDVESIWNLVNELVK